MATTLLHMLVLMMYIVLPVNGESFNNEKAVLLQFKQSVSDPHGMLSSWGGNSSNHHCFWFGVACNSKSRVVELRLGGNFSLSPSCLVHSELALHAFGISRNCSEINGQIVGKLSPVLGNLAQLRVLSLPFNGLDGEVPVEVWRLKNIVVIDLEGNSLHGNFMGFEFSSLRRLSVLNLASNKVVGRFPASLRECRDLRILNLAGNEINDVIPGFFGGFKKLQVLNLSFNKLVGSVPDILGYDCGNLEHLDLSVNFLQGNIPHALGNCGHLRTLLLYSNKLRGIIPDELGRLRMLEVLDFSKNNLVGPLPTELENTLNLSVLHQQDNVGDGSVYSGVQLSGNFLSTYKFSDRQSSNHSRKVAPPTTSPSESVDEGHWAIVEAILIAGSVISIVVAAIVVVVCYSKRNDRNTEANASSPPRREITLVRSLAVPLSYDSVIQATGNFSRNNLIGTGGFGPTYKAELSPGIAVAVKRLTTERSNGISQFQAEIDTLGRISHSNLISLIGYYSSDEDKFLIYNFLPGGNLDRFIRERASRGFDWGILHRIALNVASAISYLHDECDPCILHRDIKPSNILLDNDCNAYLADFGLSKIMGASETHVITRVAGTYGYVAPEYALTGRVSNKADVYSYGVVLLELLSDKRALDPSFYLHANGFDIVSWASLLVKQGKASLLFTARLWDSGPQDKLVKVLDLALSCTSDEHSDRPIMKDVVQRLRWLQP